MRASTPAAFVQAPHRVGSYTAVGAADKDSQLRRGDGVGPLAQPRASRAVGTGAVTWRMPCGVGQIPHWTHGEASCAPRQTRARAPWAQVIEHHTDEGVPHGSRWGRNMGNFTQRHAGWWQLNSFQLWADSAGLVKAGWASVLIL